MSQVLSSNLLNTMQHPMPGEAGSLLSFVAGSSSALAGDVGTLIASVPVDAVQGVAALPLARTGVAFNTVQGAVSLHGAMHNYSRHKESGASSLQNDTLLSAVASTARIGGGASTAAARVLSTISALKSVSPGPSSSSILGRATFFAGSVGGGLIGIMAACFSLLSLRGVKRAFSLRSALHEAKDDKLQAAKLLACDRLDTSAEKVLASMLERCNGDMDKVRKGLSIIADKKMQKWLKGFAKELVNHGMKDEGAEIRKNSKALSSTIFATLDEPAKASLKEELGGFSDLDDLSTQELFGLKMAVALDETKQVEELAAAVGQSAAGLAKELHSSQDFKKLQHLEEEGKTLQEKLAKWDNESWNIEHEAFAQPENKEEHYQRMQAVNAEISKCKSGIDNIDKEKKAIMEKISTLVEKAEASTKKSIIQGSLGFLASIVLVASIVLALAAPAGISVLAQTVVTLVATGLGFAADLWDRGDADSSKGPIGRYDKAYVKANIIADVVSTALALGATAVLSGGIVPMVIVAGLGLFWLGVSVHNYYRLSQQEREHNITSPTYKAAFSKIKNLKDDASLSGDGLVMVKSLHSTFTEHTKVKDAKEWLKNEMKREREAKNLELRSQFESLNKAFAS